MREYKPIKRSKSKTNADVFLINSGERLMQRKTLRNEFEDSIKPEPIQEKEESLAINETRSI